MSNTDEIFDYVMNSPENTNPAVLRGMLNNISSAVNNGEVNNVIDYASLTVPTFMYGNQEFEVYEFYAYGYEDGQLVGPYELPPVGTLLIGDVENTYPIVLKHVSQDQGEYINTGYERGRSSFELQTPEEDENGTELICLLNTEPIVGTLVTFDEDNIFFIPSSARFGIKKISLGKPEDNEAV